MPPPLDSPLAELEQRIQRQENVKKPDINKAIDDEIKALDKLYTDPSQDFDKEAHKARLEEFRKTLNDEEKNLSKAYTDNKNNKFDFFRTSRNELWPKAGKDLEALNNRPKKLAETYRKSRNLTDPEKGGIGEAKIDDYEGWDVWETRLSGTTNAHNPTRNTLSGYLTAMGMESDSKAQEEYAKAYKIFSDKWIDDLTHEDLREKMGFDKYLRDIAAFYPGQLLSNETKGYICGLLKLADENYPQIYDAYKEYIFDEMNKIDGTESKLNIDVSGVTNDYEKDQFRGEKQIALLVPIQNAKEWVEMFTGMKNAFEKLRSDASTLSGKLGYEYDDPAITDFLARDADSITPKDKDEMDKVSKLISNVAYGRILTKNSETRTFLQEVKTKVDAYKGDNNENLKKEMDDVIELFADVKIVAGSSPAVLINNLKMLEDVASKARVIESRLVGHEKKKEDEKEEKKEEAKEESEFMKAWKNPEWKKPLFTVDRVRVDKRIPQLPYRNDDGTRGGTIPSGTILKIVDPTADVKEVQAIRYLKVEYDGKKVWVDQSYLELLEEEVSDTREFIDDKHLLELTDGSKFTYLLGPPKIVNEGGQILIRTENKDIDKRIAWRMNDYLRIISEREGSEFKKEAAAANLKTIANVRDFLDGYFIRKGKAKEAADARGFFGAVIDAYEHSILQYETKPRLTKLREDYDEKVLPAWDNAVSEAMKLPKRPVTNPIKESVQKGSESKKDRNLEKSLGLSSVNESYRDVLRDLENYANSPEKYPNGIDIALPFNNTTTPLNVKYVSGGRVVVEFKDTPLKRYTYPSMNELAGKMNRGHLQWIRTYDVMADKDSYKGYEHLVGKIDFTDKDEKLSDKKEWQLHLEFDWEGIFDDPDVYVRPLRDGKIQYKIQWENAKYNGKKWTAGVVENFDAFINVMAHIRQWGNRYEDIPEGRKNIEETLEYKYGLLVHPGSFRKFESSIGRVVRLDTSWEDKVSLVLDWGGGNDAGSRQNARLDVSIGSDGNYLYRLTREGLPDISVRGSANSREEIAHAVAVVRVKAGF